MQTSEHTVMFNYIKEKIILKPLFIMLVGISGSGKTTAGEKIKEEVIKNGNKIELLSSDNLREELLGDVNDQSQNAVIFKEMQKRTVNALQQNCSVIYDATNLNIKDRKNILQTIINLKINCYKIAYIVPTAFSLCVANNTNRERIVPYEVLKRQLHKFQVPLYQEGFNFIFVAGYSCSDFYNQFYQGYNVPITEPWVWLSHMKNFNQENHHHHFSLLEHSILTYEEILRTTRKYGEKNIELEYAGLLHDFGKIKTKVKNDKGEFSYYGHANVGAYNFLQNLDKLGLHSFKQVLYCVALINYHMEPFGWEEAKNITVEKKKMFFGEKMYNDLMLLHKADKYACTGKRN